MGFRTRTAVAVITALAGLTMAASPAAFAAVEDFPQSTNDANLLAEKPHVKVVSTGPGTVTLDFVNPTSWLAYFEYRIDGVEVAVLPVHGYLDDVQYPGVCVEGDVDYVGCEPNVITRTFSADATVEVRHALGGEQDWFFDWTTFTVGPNAPTTMDDCKQGGWETFGFANQGQCIRFVNTGKDSR